MLKVGGNALYLSHLLCYEVDIFYSYRAGNKAKVL